MTGGELSYVPPAYKTPIVMRPVALPWTAGSEPGVAIKRVGVFPHRGLVINAWAVEAGARHAIAGSEELKLLFVTDGQGTAGREGLRHWSAVRLQPGEGVDVVGETRLEWMELSVRAVRS